MASGSRYRIKEMPKKKKPAASASTTTASEVLETSGKEEEGEKREEEKNVEKLFSLPEKEVDAEAEKPKAVASGLGAGDIPKLAIGEIIRNTPEVVYA